MNVAIAEAIGWRNVSWYEDTSGPGFWHGIPPISEEQAFKLTEDQLNELKRYGSKLPNYCGDLNAMHEAERIFDSDIIDKQSLYYDRLSLAVGWTSPAIWLPAYPWTTWGCLRATAQKRAEAFLRTLRKWVES